jgi:hypothetical protein
VAQDVHRLFGVHGRDEHTDEHDGDDGDQPRAPTVAF